MNKKRFWSVCRVQWSLHSAKLEKGAPTRFPALPSAMTMALGKDFFKKNSNFTECQPEGTRQRILKKNANFAECPLSGTRQSLIFFLNFFAECHGHSTRQSWKNSFLDTHFSSFAECCDHCTRQRGPLPSATLGKVMQNCNFYFFYIPS